MSMSKSDAAPSKPAKPASRKRARDEGEPVGLPIGSRVPSAAVVASLAGSLMGLGRPSFTALDADVQRAAAFVASNEHAFSLLCLEHPCDSFSSRILSRAEAMTKFCLPVSAGFKRITSGLPSRDEASYASLTEAQVAALPKWEREYRTVYLRYCALIRSVDAARTARIEVCKKNHNVFIREGRFPALLP